MLGNTVATTYYISRYMLSIFASFCSSRLAYRVLIRQLFWTNLVGFSYTDGGFNSKIQMYDTITSMDAMKRKLLLMRPDFSHF